MTSNNLTKKYNPFVHNMLTNIKNNKTVTIIIAVLHFLSFPSIILSQMYNFSAGYDKNPDYGFLVLAVLLTFIAGVAGLVIVSQNFTYLSKKTNVDMQLSLPLTKKQKFLSDYLSGTISYIVPFIISQLVTLIMFGIGFLTLEGKTYVDKDRAFVCDFYSEAFPYFWKILLIGILTMLFLYTLAVLIAVCCGTVGENVIYNILINAAIPGAIASVLVAWGEHNLIFPAVMRALSYTSPVGGIVALVMSLQGGDNYSGYFQTIELLPWTLVYIAIIAVLFFVAYKLFQKRKAEQTSQSFVFKSMFYAITFMMIFASIALVDADFSSEEYLIVAIFALVFYVILDTVRNRSLKNWWKGILSYLAGLLVATIVIAIVPLTNYFGRLYYVPSAESTKAVYISDNMFSAFEPFSTGNTGYFDYVLNGDKLMENISIHKYSDPENIKLLTEIYESNCNAERKKRNELVEWEYMSIYSDISFQSNLNKYITRYCEYIRIDEAYKNIVELMNSDEYKENTVRLFKEDLINSYEIYQNREYDGYQTYKSQIGITYENYSGTSQAELDFKFDKEFVDKMAKAFEIDLQNFDLNDAKYFSGSSYIIITSGGNYQEIPESFAECNKVIGEYIDIEKLHKLLEIKKSTIMGDDNHLILEPMSIFTIDGTDYYSNNYSLYLKYFDQEYIEDTKEKIADENDPSGFKSAEDIKEMDFLASVSCSSSYITTEECYTILIDGHRPRIIPAEYSDIAKRQFERQFLQKEYEDEYLKDLFEYTDRL